MMFTQLSKMVQRAGGNILKTGIILLVANAANQTLRYAAKDTMDELVMDYRRFKTAVEDRKAINLQTKRELA